MAYLLKSKKIFEFNVTLNREENWIVVRTSQHRDFNNLFEDRLRRNLASLLNEG